jgi:hypothetical protein
MKTLVCIEEAQFREVLANAVRETGLEPFAVATHAEAIEALTREPFRVMVNQLGRPPSVPDPLDVEAVAAAPVTPEESASADFIRECKRLRPEMRVLTVCTLGRRHVAHRAGVDRAVTRTPFGSSDITDRWIKAALFTFMDEDMPKSET